LWLFCKKGAQLAEEMLRFEGVAKRYGPVVALNAVDLTVRKGEFLTLLGPSGSGKTTLLNVIAGTVAPTTGRLWIGGRDVTDLPSSERRLGMVFQNYALFPHMTIFENVAFPLRVRKLPWTEIKRRVAEALVLVRLPDVGARKPRELSGGQQQRIAIARCLVYNPDLILMDEPLGALDKKLRDQMQLEIKRLHSNLGVTVLYVTHDQEEALVMSDRICLMNAGRIEQLGDPHELYFQPKSVFAADFLGDSNILDAVREGDSGLFRAHGGLAVGPFSAPGLPERIKIMIRPENLTTSGMAQAIPNSVIGVVEDIIFIGRVTKIRVRVEDDVVLTTTRLTTAEDLSLAPGTLVRLVWKSASVVPLQ
jgi:putative spermidine/putrescine transport system ATP-binding protein